MRRALPWIALIGLVPHCGLTDVDALGKPCPCPSSLRCDPATSTCVAQLGPPDAATDGSTDAATESSTDAGCSPFSKSSTLAVGRAHACVIRSGKLYCWGANDIGQVGLPQAGANVTSPSQVLPQVTKFKHVSALDGHTCALDELSAAWCWGRSDAGQSLEISGSGVTAPNQVPSNFPLLTIAAGSAVTYAVTYQDNRLLSWGDPNGGALGNGCFTGCQTLFSPSQLSTTELADHVEAGGGTGCAFTHDGRTLCWGWNLCQAYAANQAGAPTEVLEPCLRDLSIGNDFLCYIDASGHLFCRGEIAGVGATNDCLDDKVAIQSSTTFRSIDAGFAAACAITTTDELWCWGHDAHQMIASPAGDRAPTQVGAGRSWEEVSVGLQQLCAREKGSNDVYCSGTSEVVNSPGALEKMVFP
ncbi:MAG: hypothetical protein R3B13_34165 [Polyangiaceae bacterium]